MKMHLTILLIFFSATAHANWDAADTHRQASYLALHAMDWMQTHDIRANSREANPILGPHPSARQVNQYFIATAILHTGIAYALPKKYRAHWQHGTAVMQYGIVVHNDRLWAGFKYRF